MILFITYFVVHTDTTNTHRHNNNFEEGKGKEEEKVEMLIHLVTIMWEVFLLLGINYHN